MNPIDIAKDVLRIAATAGVSKEIIGLLEKKIALLTEQITTLQQENSGLISENTNLKEKVKNLEEQLANFNPQHDRLDQASYNFLNLIFENRELSIESVTATLGISKGMADYHRDLLKGKDFIKQSRSEPEMYEATPQGREYIVKNKTS